MGVVFIVEEILGFVKDYVKEGIDIMRDSGRLYFKDDDDLNDEEE